MYSYFSINCNFIYNKYVVSFVIGNSDNYIRVQMYKTLQIGTLTLTLCVFKLFMFIHFIQYVYTFVFPLIVFLIIHGIIHHLIRMCHYFH